MMRGLAIAALAALPLTAQAQTAGQARWAGTGDAFTASFQRSSGSTATVYAGAPYRAQFRINSANPYLPPHGTTAFGPTVDIYCIDFLHTANTSSSGYNAFFTRLGEPLTHTRSSNQTQYLKAAWLATQMDGYSATTTAGRTARMNIHAAIWNIMAGEPVATRLSSSGSFSSTGMNYWIAQANLASNYSTVSAAEWTVVTSACVYNSGNAGRGAAWADNCGQEFLTRNVVPEPATMILLGTGLLVTLAFAGAFRGGSAA
jgi:hypothetical protein